MAVRRQGKNLVLILAREFASKLADADVPHRREGNLSSTTRPPRSSSAAFAETGEIAPGWRAASTRETLDGGRCVERPPAGIALLERRPATAPSGSTGSDGVPRESR